MNTRTVKILPLSILIGSISAASLESATTANVYYIGWEGFHESGDPFSLDLIFCLETRPDLTATPPSGNIRILSGGAYTAFGFVTAISTDLGNMSYTNFLGDSEENVDTIAGQLFLSPGGPLGPNNSFQFTLIGPSDLINGQDKLKSFTLEDLNSTNVETSFFGAGFTEPFSSTITSLEVAPIPEASVSGLCAVTLLGLLARKRRS